MKKVIIGVSVALVLTALTAWKLLENKKVAAEKVYKADKSLKVLVKTAKASMQSLGNEQQFLGTFEPYKEIQVFAEASGKVVSEGVKDGQLISQGSLIAKLDDEILKYQIVAAEAAYQEAQNDRQNFENLIKGEAVTKNQLNKAILAEKNAEAQLKILQRQARNTNVVAPFSGIVSTKMFEVGSLVSPAVPLIRLIDISSLKLVLNVPEKDILKFRVGQSLQVATELYDKVSFEGKVSVIPPKADAAHNYAVQIIVQNGGQNALRAGMYGKVKMANELKTNSLVIPKEAVVGTSKQAQVYVVENGHAVLRDVSLGAMNNDFYEIVSGLSEGEIIVVVGQINLKNGSAVEVQE